MSLARVEKLTIRQLYERYAGARGQRTIIGSPMQIAEHMTEWFLTYGVDDFLIQPPYLPGELNDFVDQVIPEARARSFPNRVRRCNVARQSWAEAASEPLLRWRNWHRRLGLGGNHYYRREAA